MLQKLLEVSGHAVTTAASVAQAVGAFAAADFDLLISDIGLPDGTGLDIMRQVRRATPPSPASP